MTPVSSIQYLVSSIPQLKWKFENYSCNNSKGSHFLWEGDNYDVIVVVGDVGSPFVWGHNCDIIGVVGSPLLCNSTPIATVTQPQPQPNPSWAEMAL